jgi:hypothetical protein
VSDDIFDRYSRDAKPKEEVVVADPAHDAMFSKYDRTEPATAVKTAPSWKDIEAAENLAASGGTTPQSEEPKKPGRGIWQAIKDYPGHVLHGLVDTVAAPGNVLTSPQPSTSESLIPSAVGIAGLATGSEFPKVGGAALAEKGIAKVAPSTTSINRLVDAIGPENVPEAVNRLQSNPRLTLADVSDPVRTMTQGLIDPAQPKIQNLVSERVKERQASLPSAVNSAYTEAMGAAPDVVKMVEGLKDRTKEVGKTMIEPAIENAQPIATKSILRAIDKQIGSPEAIRGETPRIPLDPTQIKLLNIRKSITDGEMAPLNERVGLSVGAVNDAIKNGGMSQGRLADFTEARRLLNSARRGFTSEEDLVSGLKTLAAKQKITGPIDDALAMIKKGPTEARGADFLHGIQSRLRETAEGLRTSAVGSERNMSKDLFDTRNSIVEAIDKASGKAYRPALSKYRDAMQVHEAFDAGFDTLKNRSGVKGLEDRPEALKEWVKDATPEEVVARRLGTRADIDQKIRAAKNQALAGESITRIEYNQEKLRTLFGDKEANRLIRVMKDAQDEAATNAKLMAGSKTAETLAGQKALEVRKVGGGNPLQYFAPVAAEILGQGAGLPGMGLAGSLVAKGAHMGAQKIGQMHDVARNYEFARNALTTGPAREATINRLLAHPKVVSQLKKSSNALTAP